MAAGAGYQPVRPASPSRLHNEVEPHEGMGADAHRQRTDVEQQERLLSDDEDDDEGDDLEKDLERKSSCCRPWLLWLLAFVGLLVILLLAVFLRIGKEGTRTSKSFRRPSSDYILEANWNFTAPPQVREYHWTIQDIVANPDGVFRPMLVVNGKFPGEMIRCNEGDTIVVNVVNKATNATSIHWHGISQNGTNWMDGAPGITQCPIAPGASFRYEFTVKGQTGTYFYHGHQAAQGLDGLVGPLVIHERGEKEKQASTYASDRVILLQDWYYDPSSGLLREKLSPGSESSPIPNSALINGANKVDCALHPMRRCDSTSASLATLDLQPNAHHRLRLLNVGAFAWFEVTIDEHLDLPIIEVDGTDIEPSPETGILIGPGQRYSVVLTAQSSNSSSFWFRARMLKHCFSENVLPEDGFDEAKAVFRYSSSSSANELKQLTLPTTENDSGKYTTECKDMTPSLYKPVPARPAPEYAHHSWYLRVNLGIGDWRLERGHLNTSSFRPNLESPTLHRVVDGLASNNESFRFTGVNDRAFDPETELVISHNRAEVVDVILQNVDEGNHPFHLHGHQVFVLASGHGYFPGYESLGLAPEGKGLLDPTNSSIIDNPLRRDVATVEGFGWLLVRFVADNPGLWLFHCHMVWHGESGMAMQFLSRLDILKDWVVPEGNLDLCKASVEELEKGAPPKDSFWYGST